MSDVKIGVIPAGGLGTRFLPASAAIPKEMFPVFDTPLIAFAIEEMAEAGVSVIYIIVSPWKKPLFERYFNSVNDLKERLLAQGKTALVEKMTSMSKWPKIILIEQPEPQGLAQAVSLCKDEIAEQPFLLLLPDEVLLKNSKENALPCKLMTEVYERTKKSCVGFYKVPLNEVSNYGVAKIKDSPEEKLGDKNIWSISKLVEKPEVDKAPSQFMLPGRYLLTANFWQTLEVDLQKLEQIKKYSEIHMTDALDRLAKNNSLLGLELDHDRYDVGQPMGYFELIKDLAQFKGKA